MPHFTVEYSANLQGEMDLQAFCDTIRRAALATGVFETGAIRVRAVRCDDFSIADGDPRNSFIDVSVRIGTGRELATRKQVGEQVFAAMKTFLASLFDGQHLALSLEVREIDPQLSYRKNSIHERLRKHADAGS
jgi:5-carboxymethyl-2-hydroxymuconate isomerase